MDKLTAEKAISDPKLVRYCFDIDNTLCHTPYPMPYEDSTPYLDRIEMVNHLYDRGATVILLTARTENFRALTERQLRDWGVKYHELHLSKPMADIYIDDLGVGDIIFFNTMDVLTNSGENNQYG